MWWDIPATAPSFFRLRYPDLKLLNYFVTAEPFSLSLALFLPLSLPLCVCERAVWKPIAADRRGHFTTALQKKKKSPKDEDVYPKRVLNVRWHRGGEFNAGLLHHFIRSEDFLLKFFWTSLLFLCMWLTGILFYAVRASLSLSLHLDLSKKEKKKEWTVHRESCVRAVCRLRRAAGIYTAKARAVRKVQHVFTSLSSPMFRPLQ